MTLDLYGDGFLQVAVPTGSEAEGALIEQSGKISASGGRVELKAATVREAIREAVNMSGVVAARSVSGRDGAIVLGGGPGGKVRVIGRMTTVAESSASKSASGKISVSGHTVEIGKDAKLEASTTSSERGGVVEIAGDLVFALGTVTALGAEGGLISVTGGAVFVGGSMDASAAESAGGAYHVTATSYVELDPALVTVAGVTQGGTLTVTADNIFSSGTQDASASEGVGGSIALDGLTINLVDATLDASGATGGGTILVGGDVRGSGTMRHADKVFVSATTLLDVSASTTGDGGKIVMWAYQENAFYGTAKARGGTQGGWGLY